jgi:outer membrane protein
MRIIRHAFLALTCMFFNSALLAQDSTLIGLPLKWDIQKCIAYAKEHNIQINSLRLSQKISEQESLLSQAARLPDLSASASQNFTHANATGSGRSSFGASGSYGVSSSVTLYNGNYINNNIRQKSLQLQAANLDVIQQENDITLQVTQAYLTILLDKENIIYNNDVVTTSQAQLKQYQQKYDVGAISRKDLVQLQAQVATDKYNLVNAQNAERQDKLTLKQLLLLPTEADFDIVKPDTIIAPPAIVSPLREAQQVAMQTRPEIKLGQLGVDIAQYDVAKAQSGYKPFLSAGGSLSSGYNTGSGSYFSQLNRNFEQQIGLNLSIPIFTKRQVLTQVNEAKINVDQAKLNFDNTRITLSQQVERAYISVQNAQQQYDAAKEEFTFNQESYRIANEQLRVGVANIVDFLQQKNLYIQAQQSYIQAKYNALLSLKIYDFYKGLPITL